MAYFPIPYFWGMDDTALDAAVTMKFIIRDCINKIFSEYDLPQIAFRIGLDSGYASIETIGSDSIKQHKDLIGKTINITSKIQSVADNGDIVIGDNMLKRLHNTRRNFL